MPQYSKMDLKTYLEQNSQAIVKKWRDVIVDSYPGDSRRFLRKEKDQFANPVGHIITKDLESLVKSLSGDETIENASLCLENIIRVRAVQDFKPSDAVGFVMALKRILRESLREKGVGQGDDSEIRKVEESIDRMALLAFDIYSQCRQKIFDIRVKEVKNQLGKLLERSNLTFEIPED